MHGRHGHRHGPRHSGRAAHLLEPALLCSLLSGPAHGYLLAETLDGFGVGQVSLRRIYRMLRDMEASGWVASDWETEQTQGPPRRVYALTSEGRTVLESWATYLKESRDAIDRLLEAFEESE